MTINNSRLAGFRVPLIVLTVGYLLLALFYWFLRFDVASVGDPAWYWRDSLEWWAPFNRYHVPGFAVVIALLRTATLGALPPAVIMTSITGVALLVGAWAVYQSIRISGISEEYAVLGACLYGLWPCVGLTSAVFPYADAPALALLLSGLLALECARPRTAAVCFGLALVFHKSTWLFVGLILLAEICRGKGRSFRNWPALLALVLPIGVVWLLGALHYHSLTWLLSTSLDVGSETRRHWPLLDGILGSVSAGGLKSVVKGGLVVALAALAAALVLLTFRQKGQNWQYDLALSLGCLFLFVFLTRIEIWAAVRFSRLLVLPLIGSLARRPAAKSPNRLAAAVLLLVLLSSQFGIAWYSAKVFYGKDEKSDFAWQQEAQEIGPGYVRQYSK